MKFLLDTHALIWATDHPEALSARAASLISDVTNEVFVSAASAWEIATKVRLGKLPEAARLEANFLEIMQRSGYTLLNISVLDALRGGRLPGTHRDPFDRILAAQALTLDIPILSLDSKLDAFGIHRIW